MIHYKKNLFKMVWSGQAEHPILPDRKPYDKQPWPVCNTNNILYFSRGSVEVDLPLIDIE